MTEDKDDFGVYCPTDVRPGYEGVVKNSGGPVAQVSRPISTIKWHIYCYFCYCVWSLLSDKRWDNRIQARLTHGMGTIAVHTSEIQSREKMGAHNSSYPTLIDTHLFTKSSEIFAYLIPVSFFCPENMRTCKFLHENLFSTGGAGESFVCAPI